MGGHRLALRQQGKERKKGQRNGKEWLSDTGQGWISDSRSCGAGPDPATFHRFHCPCCTFTHLFAHGATFTLETGRE
eukprot:1159257-Pelagomonas_calceolata.AAC.6